MATFTYEKQIDVRPATEVLVVGAGPAGLGAAISAARNGAKTLLVERFGYVGGNLTAGLVGPCMTSFSLDGKTQLIRGIFDEMIRRMEDEGAAIHPSEVPAGSPYAGFITYGHDKVTPFDPEAVKTVALQMLLEAGVQLQFHTMAVDALVENGAITGVVLASKSGLELQPCQAAVDCSADGDLAALAGVSFEIGRASDGLMQPMTLFFRVGGVDDERVERYVADHPEEYRPFATQVAEARKEGRFPIPRKGIGMYKTLRPGVWRINTTRILGRDGTNARDLSEAEIEGRSQMRALVRFFRESLPGFENSYLLDTAATMGVRETRRVAGDYQLTLADLQTGRHFDDVIALCGYPVDIHDPTGDGGGVDQAFRTANEYEIPYRSLLPKGIEGLLVAGRSVSSTHEALGAIRVMPPAFAMGQAAGTAAGLAVRTGVLPRELDVSILQRRLLQQGAYLGTVGRATKA